MTAGGVPVFDPAPLERQTMGDRTLRVEVLTLFVAEAERLVHQVEAAQTGQVRDDRLHALAGLARNVGAARLAQTARMLQAHVAEEEPDIEPLRTALTETLAFVRENGV